jgi:ADP-ribosylation factor GTPase-activating protein 2/3
MFFEQGSYDPATVAEGRTWLAQFQGARSISSNQYFGRDEEETLSQGSDRGLLGDGSLLRLETFLQPLICWFEDLPSGDETIPDND